MKRVIFIVSIIFATTAQAQQQDDPKFCHRALSAIQIQRNNALDNSAVLEAKISELSEELTKIKARIKEYEDKK